MSRVQLIVTSSRHFVRTLWVTVCIGTLAACGGAGGGGIVVAPPATPQRGDLMAVTSSSSINLLTVNLALAELEQENVDVSALRGIYQVSLNRIVYKTVTPDGRLIDASGVVAYPLKFGNTPSPVLSYQHATTIEDVNAPSQYTSTDNVLAALAGSGFIVVMPDYIGYGASTNEVHTYVHAQGLAAAVVDMLRAARQLLANDGIRTNQQLFLAGHSEGGYATLAAQKEMEQNLAGEFAITASMPGAGPYDMSATAQYIVGSAINPRPVVTGFVFKAYDHWLQWNRLPTIFQSPYDVVVNTYYDGDHTSAAISAALTTDSASLFAPAFRNDFLGSGEMTIKAGFAANNIYDWAPVTPTRLFHGVDDDIVPYSNAVTAVTAMTAAGSISVQLVSCDTGSVLIPRNHENCLPDYLSRLFNWFGPLAGL